MTRIRFRRFDWILLAIAIVFVTWPSALMPLRSWGKLSFASAYRKVHIGMSRQEWQNLQRDYGVEAVCDGNSCYVYDVFRTYNVNCGRTQSGDFVVTYKQMYFHFPFDRQY